MDDHLIHEPRIRRGRRPRLPGGPTSEPRGTHRPAGEAAAGAATLPQPLRAADEAAPPE
jgi:hypothetical protein